MKSVHVAKQLKAQKKKLTLQEEVAPMIFQVDSDLVPSFFQLSVRIMMNQRLH